MRKLALAAVVTVVSATFLLIVGPQRISMADTATGDLGLSTHLREHSEAGFNNLTAFTLDQGKATFAGLGANEHTEVEIGSVTKMFTGEIAHQLVEEGKIRLDTTMGEILEVGDSPVSDVTVRELLDHTSGLPRQAKAMTFSSAVSSITGSNPYAGVSTQDIVDSATESELADRGT